MHDNFAPLRTHTSAWSTENSFEVAGLVNLPKPMYETFDTWFNCGKKAEVVQ